jgi:fumarate reductase flavoprotein subunit
MNKPWDVIIIGAGTVGLPAAIFAAQRSDKILVLDAAPDIGGTLHLSGGQMSAAGTRLQQEKGIEDSPALHFEDVMRISKNTADSELVGLAVNNAAETMDWLETIGFQPLPGHPVKGQDHEPYSVQRYVWGAELGQSVLAVLRPQFEAVVESGRVTLKLSTRVTRLVQEDDGAVTGVVTSTEGGAEETFSARSVVIAAGGYVANASLYEELSGHPAYADYCYPHCVGDGLTLGLAAGGVSRGREHYLTSFGSVMQSYDVPSKVRCDLEHWPERRMPWEIYVNVHGKRFIREDEPSVDVREHILQGQPDVRYWIVCDAVTLKEAPPLCPAFSPDEIKTAAESGEPMFYVADTIAALGEKAGLPGDVLAETVTAFNDGQARGVDYFGRSHLPRPVAKAPFYAIRAQGISVSGVVGLKVNNDLQIIRDDGTPVLGLYAAGETLGAGATMGNAICGGMLVTPALTFGRILGQHLLPMSG